MRSWLSSPRRRRRLAWIALPLLALAGALTALVAFGGEGKKYEPDLKLTGEAQVLTVAPEIKLTRAQRAEADRVLREFVGAAVLRRDVDEAWRLSAPQLKAGVTRDQWQRGELPVQPYPARTDKLSWRVLKAYTDHVELDVLLFPRPKAELGPMSFAVELQPAGKTWAVSYWYPRRALAGGGAASSKPPAAVEPAPTKPTRDTNTGRLSHAFFLIPLAILSLIVLVPLIVVLTTWYRGRRAYQRYASRREL